MSEGESVSTKAIEVENLTKIFKKTKNSKKETADVVAVDHLTFGVDAGEIVAFIGPNGGGKSTTIKMLTSILYPTSGTASVLGLTPWKSHDKLCRQIGAVFGQKSQLYYHLPATDSFHLLAAAYGLSSREENARIKELAGQFEIEEFLLKPVRNLSLGQRMRCELVASLLHRPKVLFLDEPTIGLDIEAKHSFRAFLKEQAQKDGTTVFLTSHDMGDIESLCRRILIINHGKLVIESNIDDLLSTYMTNKTITLRYPNGTSQDFQFDTKTENLSQKLQSVLDNRVVSDISIRQTDLETIIAQIYKHDQ